MHPADDWIACVKEELASSWAPDSLSSTPTPISRVPSPLRAVKPSAFTPQTVAIGPYNRKLSCQQDTYSEMEAYKITAAKAIAQTFESQGNFSLLVENVTREENRWRPCFAKGMGLEDFNQEQLGYMFALDAAFVVAILHWISDEHRSGRDDKDVIFPPWKFCRLFAFKISFPVRKAILLDFLLLENQIPLFLLKKVIQMDEQYVSSDRAEARIREFLGIIAQRVLAFSTFKLSIDRAAIERAVKREIHLLDCLHTIVIDSSENANSSNELDLNPVTPVPTATRLHNAGVRFKGHTRSLSEIQFEGNTLILPTIHVGDDTERVFRNLMAYESQMMTRWDVLSYLSFMNFLVNTAKDVSLLVDAGVMSETIGSNEHVAELWNQLSKNTVCIFTKQYSEAGRRANEYVNKAIHGVLTEFRKRYFSRPWLTLSLLYAIALFVMTFITMWYTMEVYLKG